MTNDSSFFSRLIRLAQKKTSNSCIIGLLWEESTGARVDSPLAVKNGELWGKQFDVGTQFTILFREENVNVPELI